MPQAQTKIMNEEGWSELLAHDDHDAEGADRERGRGLRGPSFRNGRDAGRASIPTSWAWSYSRGNIEHRWDTGKFGPAIRQAIATTSRRNATGT